MLRELGLPPPFLVGQIQASFGVGSDMYGTFLFVINISNCYSQCYDNLLIRCELKLILYCQNIEETTCGLTLFMKYVTQCYDKEFAKGKRFEITGKDFL
jgi:hypothetical protein